MSDRALSRHRAPQRAITPLSDLGDALTGPIAIVGRSSAIVAMSTGLIASVSAPAQAVNRTAVSSAESANVLTTSPLSTGRSSLLSSSSPLARGAVIAAPRAATVRFETKAFTAAPVVRKAVKVTVRTISPGARVSRKASGSDTVRTPAVAPKGSVGGSSVLAIAARYLGIPYVYGGTTPQGFDCSGYTSYVYRQLGTSLPRTANQQMAASRRISRSQARAGDLVFFVSGGRAYHTGIYAGKNMIYDAPRAGKSVSKRAIWSADVVFGRVTG